MNHLRKPAVWAPLVGYLLLASMLLLVVNGVAWIVLHDEDALAIVYLRLHLFLGLCGGVCCFVFIPKPDTYKKSSRGAMAAAFLMFVGFLSCIISRPELLDSFHYLNVGAVVVGVGFALALRSSVYFIKQIEPRRLILLFSALGIVSILSYSIIDGCPQTLGIVLILIIPLFAALLFSGIFPKYDTSSEFVSGISLGDEVDDESSPEKQIPAFSLGLFVFALSCYVQQSYYFSIITPTMVYSSFNVSFISSVLILAIVFVVLGRAVSQSITFRLFHGVALVAALVVLGLILSGSTNGLVVGMVFSITSLCLGAYLTFYLSSLWSCSLFRRKMALLGTAAPLFVLLCLFEWHRYLPFIEVHFASQEFALICSCVTFSVLAALVVTSSGKLLFLKGENLFERIENSLHRPSGDYRREGCVALAKDAQLTEREEEILVLLVQGQKNKAIAEKLFVSVNTVNNHVRNIYIKTEVHSRLELIKKIDSALHQ